MIASKGLRPALLFFASSGVSTTASISARKLSHGTSAVIASSGSPFSDNAASRLSASKNPSCPIARSAESRPHERDSHSTKRQPIIRGALIIVRPHGRITMDGKTAIFFIVAYLIPSAGESIAHRLLLHATTQERVRWRQWGWLGQLFRLAYFYHNRI